MADEIKLGKSPEHVAFDLFNLLKEMDDDERLRQLEIFSQCLAAAKSRTVERAKIKHG